MKDWTPLNLARGWAFKLHIIWMPVSRKNVRSPPPTVFKTILKPWSRGFTTVPSSQFHHASASAADRPKQAELGSIKPAHHLEEGLWCRAVDYAVVQVCRNSTPPLHYKTDSLQTETIHYKMPRYKMSFARQLTWRSIQNTRYMMFGLEISTATKWFIAIKVFPTKPTTTRCVWAYF